jgi:16S rRNA (cytosine967-C5)-methyltransferase
LSADRGQTRRLDSPGARDIAVDVLRDDRDPGPFTQHRLDRLVAERKPSRADAGLATELALGVVRHRLTLDHLLSRVFHGDMRHIDPRLLPVLRVGAYQLVWLDRIPPFAAVDSAVDQAKRLAGRRAGGLVNALLRQILRHRRDEVVPDPPDQPRRCIRIDRDRWRAFDTDLFADPASDRAGYLAAATSHPAHLVRRWLDRFGRGKTEQICLAGSLRPPLVLRVNRRRTGVRALMDRLAAEGTTAVACASTDAVFVSDAQPVREMQAIADGHCQPQDVTAQSVVRAAPPRPGQKVLDLCAGPGTKTTQLADYMEDRGLILACDRSAAKIASIEDHCRRMGVTCARAVPADELDTAAAQWGPFDLALVDVPCSNSGVLARRPEARYRITAERLGKLADAQSALLARAARHVRPGGKIIYATCSIEPDENEHVVQRFLTGPAGRRLLDSKQVLPRAGQALTDWRDGGFWAVMVLGQTAFNDV